MNFELTLDSQSSKPYVVQIQEQLRLSIRRNLLHPGEKVPSLRTLCRASGVSLGTVKQAINTLTTEGYLRSHPGRGVFVAEPHLRRRHVALVLPSVELESMGMILRGVKDGLRSGSHRLLVQAADLDFDQEGDLLAHLDTSYIAGALIYPPPVCEFLPQLHALAERGVPYVLVNTAFSELNVNAVVPDMAEAGRLAVAHLIENGHRRIGIVDHTGDSASNRSGREGMGAAFAVAGIRMEQVPRILTEVTDLNATDPWENGRRATRRLLADHPDLTAVLGVNENLSMGVLQALKAMGRRVPEDLSVIAIGDLRIFEASEPPMTCVRIPHEELGRQAALRLVDVMAGEPIASHPAWVQLEPLLVRRGSVQVFKDDRSRKTSEQTENAPLGHHAEIHSALEK